MTIVSELLEDSMKEFCAAPWVVKLISTQTTNSTPSAVAGGSGAAGAAATTTPDPSTDSKLNPNNKIEP